MQNGKLNLSLPLIKVNFKWIKDFNGRPESIKLLELNLEKTLLETVWECVFNHDTKAQAIKKVN